MDLTPCQSLDDYLARDLTDDERARFTAHLTHCPDCRLAVHEHDRLGALLSAAVAQLDRVPERLIGRIESRLLSARRRRIMLVATGVAALVGVVWLLGHALLRPGKVTQPVVEVRPEPPRLAAPSTGSQVRVLFPARANVVALPQETGSPNVTLIWVYPGLRHVPRPAPAARESSSPLERNNP
jgi:anti-sigma factor RsiW